MTSKLDLTSLISICSIALSKLALSSIAVLGDITISKSAMKVDNLANSMQICLDSGDEKVLLPITLASDLGSVSSELVGCFSIIFYNSAQDAVFKPLSVE